MAYELNEIELKFIERMKVYKFHKKIDDSKLNRVTALLHACDFTIQDFEIKLGLPAGSVTSAIHRSGHKKAEAYLAAFLEKPLAELWPHKYDENFFTEVEKLELEAAKERLNDASFMVHPFSTDDIRDAILIALNEPIRLHAKSTEINRALAGKCIEGEVIIGEILNMAAYDIWPERYAKRRVKSSSDVHVSLPPGV